MAAPSKTALKSVPRLMTSLRVSPTLFTKTSAAVTTPATTRNLVTFRGVQGAVQPWKITVTTENEEVEENLHLEALERWRSEAKRLEEIRVLPPCSDNITSGGVQNMSSEQMEELLEIEEEDSLYDITRNWVTFMDH